MMVSEAKGRASCPAARPHVGELRSRFQQGDQFMGEGIDVEIARVEDRRGAGLLEHSGVLELLAATHVSEGHQQGRAARQGQLGHRDRSRATHHEICRLVSGRHVGLESDGLRRQLGVAVRCFDSCLIALARLVHDVNRRVEHAEGGDGSEHALVDLVSSLASAEDEKLPRGAVARRADLGEGFSQRAAQRDARSDHPRLGVPETFGGLGEAHEDLLGETGQEPVRGAGHHIGVDQNHRDAAPGCGERGGRRGIAPHGDDSVRAELAQQTACLPGGSGQSDQTLHTIPRRAADQGARIQGLQVEARFGDQSVLDPALRTDEEDRLAGLLQHLAKGKGRSDVASRASTGYDPAQAHGRCPAVIGPVPSHVPGAWLRSAHNFARRRPRCRSQCKRSVGTSAHKTGRAG